MNYSILVVDDEIEMCSTLTRIMKMAGYSCEYATDPFQVEKAIATVKPDLLILDVRMPSRTGLQILSDLHKKGALPPTIMISGYTKAENVVLAMKIGAINFYDKPLNIPALLEEVRVLAESSKPAQPNDPSNSPIVTKDPGMSQVLHLARKAAQTEAPVLITGESGTGKELLAKMIHDLSGRSGGPFVAVNCAAIPEALLESELFGHEKGAFTDASACRIGKFQEAEHGSIFLDEIGEMSNKAQAKLLRILQEKKYERLGSNLVRNVDVRILAATNRSLSQMTGNESFRSDLFYRLSVIRFELPPLRERPEDILILARHFLREFSEKYGKKIVAFSSQVERTFRTHVWPGNIRELRNCVERAVIFSETDTIGQEALPLQYDEIKRTSTSTYQELIDQVQRERILDVLEKSGGNKSAAASLLGITRKTLYNRLKVLGVPL